MPPTSIPAPPSFLPIRNPNAKVGEIFSESEHRCVALAAFLAELVTAQRYSGIVFDDPMSSLGTISDYIRPVLERLDNKIKPTSMFKLGIITEYDVNRVMVAQSKLSEDLHSSAQALDPEAVSLDDLLNEVKALEEWIQSIRDRQKNAIKPALT